MCALVLISPATTHEAGRDHRLAGDPARTGPRSRTASSTVSLIWSAILSGWPSVTDSDVNVCLLTDSLLARRCVRCSVGRIARCGRAAARDPIEDRRRRARSWSAAASSSTPPSASRRTARLVSTSKPASAAADVVADDEVEALARAACRRRWRRGRRSRPRSRRAPGRRAWSRPRSTRKSCVGSSTISGDAVVLLELAVGRRLGPEVGDRGRHHDHVACVGAAAMHRVLHLGRGLDRARPRPPGGDGPVDGGDERDRGAARGRRPRRSRSPASPTSGCAMTRTASIGSRVPPAVTSTRDARRGRPGASAEDARAPRPTMRAGSARRPAPTSPPASRPASGSTTCTPRRRSVARFSCTAGCSHISVCIAGHTSTGARVASSVAVSRSSEMPAAYLPSSFAVAGATTTRSAVCPRRVCGIGSGPSNSDVRAGSDASAENVTRADEALRVVGEHRRDVRAGVDQPAADLDGLVRGDPAATRRGRRAGRAARSGSAPWRDGSAGLGARRARCGRRPSAAVGRVVDLVGSMRLELDLAGRDLLERDRQRLARHRRDLRRHDLAEALAELVVVVVDLAGPHRRQRHQRELRVDLVASAPRCGVRSATRGGRPFGSPELGVGPQDQAPDGLRTAAARRRCQDSSDLGRGLARRRRSRRPRRTRSAPSAPRPRPGRAGGRATPGSSRAPRLEPAPLLVARRRLDEHEQRVGDAVADRERALDVDLEQHVVAGGELVERRTASGVPFRSP